MNEDTTRHTRDSEPHLSIDAKRELRAYILRSVALPGSITAVVLFVLGFLVQYYLDVRAENIGYEVAIGNLHSRAAEVAVAVVRAQNNQKRVDELLTEVEIAVRRADLAVEKIEAVDAIQKSEDLVDDVAAHILGRADITAKLSTEFDARVSAVEAVVQNAAEGVEDCEWVSVGYNKSHAHDNARWCPVGSFLSQLDMDSGRNGSNYPIVARALCCQALP